MDVQNRMVSVSTRRVAFGAAMVLGIMVVAFTLFASLVRTAQPFSMTAPQVIASSGQSPDAQDRNEAYSQAVALKWHNQSPDAQERNAQLAK